MADDRKTLETGRKPEERSDGNTNGEIKGNDGSVREDAPGQKPQQEAKKPFKIKEIWHKTGLDVPTILMMFKGSLPPTIAIAMFQAKDVQEVYQTLGYLVAITSVLGMCIMPRGMFVQNM